MSVRKTAFIGTVLAVSSLYILASPPVSADDRGRLFKDAYALYEKGMLGRAKAMFDEMDDVQAEGYSVLCSVGLKEVGYETDMEAYLSEYPYSGLGAGMLWRHALNLFDAGDYAEAGKTMERFQFNDVDKSSRAEYLYKRAYCYFEGGDRDAALPLFERVTDMEYGDFTSPASYGAGYINYEKRNFGEALSWFEQSAGDPRFSEVSNYYIMECRFMMKDYAYVIEHGDEVFDKIPDERKPRLARIISESYLVRGDTANAKKYYDEVGESGKKNRTDYFYAGTLMYSTGDYASAIDNYEKMTDRSDSIGQIADYNLAYSYIRTKNKVAALGAFKSAAESSCDPHITEDAYYNYAKLAFDLNKDNTAFNGYMKKYSDKEKNDEIYGYMALSALYDRDYAGAVETYNKIDELDPDMTANYMKANYLRANQLISGASWRNAVPCLKAVSFYSDRQSAVNRLSRYWLAESYYRDDRYEMARTVFTELYNVSALDGREEGSLLPYNIAYCYYKEGKYDLAARWFDEYARGGGSMKKDAMVRRADCLFAEKKYKDAAQAYMAASDEIADADEVYPYYQAGLAYGLADDLSSKIASLERVSGAHAGSAYYNEASYELGRAYLAAGRNDDAASQLKSLAEGSGDKAYVARALLDLGTIERNEKKYDSALGYYKKVVAEMPGTEFSSDALAAMNLIYQAKGEPEAYVAYVESLDSPSATAGLDMEELVFGAAEQSALAGSWEKALTLLQNYKDRYPQGKFSGRAEFYMAESYRGSGRKEQAVDSYARVLAGSEDTFKENAALTAAKLSFELENYSAALGYYKQLSGIARQKENVHAAALGMMESAYRAKLYSDAITYAGAVETSQASSKQDKLEAVYVKAKSALATSDRASAMKWFSSISGNTGTPQGAEAAYMLIQNSYDEGRFADVEKQVYAFSDSGTGQTYWLAKAFILLGDSFAERDDLRQARATFESVRDGYTSTGADDDVLDNVKMRLSKLDELGK